MRDPNGYLMLDPEDARLGAQILRDATHALMTRSVFDALLDYSCSMPSGVVPGKNWKRQVMSDDGSRRWVIGSYVATEDPSKCGIEWREVLVLPDPPRTGRRP